MPASGTRSPVDARCAACLFALLSFSGCGGGGATSPAGPPSLPVGTAAPVGNASNGRYGISHVVIVIQENRSFDYLFHGYPGADTASSGRTHDGKTVPLTQIALESAHDIDHQVVDFLEAYDGGRMDGFDLEGGATGPGSGSSAHTRNVAVSYPAYGYAPPAEVQQYWTLAHRYVLADRMFPSQLDASWTAHQFLIAGQAGGTANNPDATPWGCDAPSGTLVGYMQANRTVTGGVFPCFSYPTLAAELDAAGVSWRYYAPPVFGGNVGGLVWSAFDAIKPVRYGPDWVAHVVSPETRFLSNVAAGQLAGVTWIVPDLANSDHAGSGSATGPDWIASIVNAVGRSKFWNSSAIFVMWDDWGGWYDHVPPPQIDRYGLGIRVPLLIVSPLAKSGVVSHTQYESGSLLKFAEQTFSLAPLAKSDARANALDDAFAFGQARRPYQPLSTHRRPADFIREAPSLKVPDAE